MTSPDQHMTPTSTSEMLERTRRRPEQMRRRRRVALSSVAVAVVAFAIAVPVLADAGHHTRVVGVNGTQVSGTQVSGAPTSVVVAPTTTVTTASSSTISPPGTPTTLLPPIRPTTTRPSSTTSVPATTTSPPATHPLAVPACTTSQLSASLTNPNGAAGSVGYNLNLVNTGAATCSVTGYPGVSYVAGSNGTMVGAPASRDAVHPVVTVVLAPGQAARALLIEVDSLNYPTDTCQLSSVNGLRVYPPNQTAALFIAQSTQACANPADPVLQIGPVLAS